MVTNRSSGFILVALLVTSVAAAQFPIGAVGFSWSGTTTPSAGNFCWGFSCAPDSVTVAVGETVTIRVRGDYQQPYAIGFSTSATRCITIPGVLHNLILDDPITVVWTGFLVVGSPILACPSGTDAVTVVIPPFFPSGTTFALQAVAGTLGPAGSQLSFTSALAVTVS